MYLCAYELNIPNIENLRNEIREYTDQFDWEGDWPPCQNYKEIGPNVIKFYKIFNHCFMNTARIIKSPAETNWLPHIEIDHGGKFDKFKGEIDNSQQINAVINILVLNSIEDEVKFYFDRDLNKLYHPTKEPPSPEYSRYGIKKDLKLIDKFNVDKNPVLINTGTWHAIKNKSPRIGLSFFVHPWISFEAVVNFCRDNNMLIER